MVKKRKRSGEALDDIVRDFFHRVTGAFAVNAPAHETHHVPHIVECIPVTKGKKGLRLDSYSNLLIPRIGAEGKWRDFAFRIPFSTYIAYKSKSRPRDNGDDNLWRYVTPYDMVINEIASALRDEFFYFGIQGKETQAAQLALDFVHKIPYSEKDTKEAKVPCYAKYPVETLFEFGGNCADLSILYASLLTNFSIDCCIVCIRDHAVVGVAVEAKGQFIEYNSRRYYLADAVCRSDPWTVSESKIGEDCLKSSDIITSIYSGKGVYPASPKPKSQRHIVIRNIL